MGMMIFLTGLLLFLGVHSVRIVADDWREKQRRKLGVQTWRGIYAVLSLIGFALLVWGWGMVREAPTVVWIPPRGMRHAASLFTLLAFILLVAAYVPGNAIKARVHHPMVAGVKLWAVAHLMANGNLAHIILFGSFLAWAVVDFIAARKRDRLSGAARVTTSVQATLITVVVGVVSWVVFAFWLHGWLFGVKPFG